MSEMEPQSNEPNEINNYIDRATECFADQGDSVVRIYFGQMTDDFVELHFVPKVEEVQNQSQQNDDTQNEHVLRCPFYGLRASVHQITVVTARLPVCKVNQNA